MKQTTKLIAQLSLAIGLTALLPVATTFAAVTGGAAGGAAAAQGDGQPSDLFGNTGILTEIINIILFIVGILSVIMLIYGGLRYVISGGDSKKVTDAKNTIMYAIIGLIISILSFAIVNFIINAFSEGDGLTITP